MTVEGVTGRRSVDGTVAVRVEPMHRGHLRQVDGIERQVYTTPWSKGLWTDELRRRDRDGDRVYLCATEADGSRLLGYAGLLLVVGDGHVATVAVDPSRQGRGLGAVLLLGLARAGIGAGCRSLTLEVRVSNEPARRLYDRFGFVPAGTRAGYYPDNGETALVMWAHDVDRPDYAARLDRIEATLAVPTRWSVA